MLGMVPFLYFNEELMAQGNYMKSFDCRYCGSNKYELILSTDSGWQIVRCDGCGLARTNPQPETNYDEQSDYFEHYLNNEKLFRSFFKPLVQFIGQHICGGKLLEIGCSVGFLLEEAKMAGYLIEGVELNKKAAALCADKGITVNNCNLMQCQFPSDTFDVVVLSHVLEHITDLKEFLNEIYRILSPSGFIVLSQPTFSGLIPRILRQKWYGWAPKDHVWHFTPESISHVLAQSGFEVKGVEKSSMHYPFGFGIRTITVAIVARLSSIIGSGDQFYIAAQKINK